MACFLMLFSFYANKVEASEMTTLTMDQEIEMKVHGVKIKGGLGKKILRFVDVNDPSIFYTKYHQDIIEVKLADGTYDIYDLTTYANGNEEVDYTAHYDLNSIGQVTVENGKPTNGPVVLDYNDSALYLKDSSIQLEVVSTETGAKIKGELGKQLWFKDVNSSAQATKIVGQDSTVSLGEATYLIYDTTDILPGFTPPESNLIGVVKVTKPKTQKILHVTLTVPW